MISHRNPGSSLPRTKSAFDAVSTFGKRKPERYALHARYMNATQGDIALRLADILILYDN